MGDLVEIYPLVMSKWLLKMAIYSEFSHKKWWFSIVMLVYQRVSNEIMPYYFVVHILIWCLCGIFAFNRCWETERLYVSADEVSSSVGVLFKPWLNSPNLFNRYCGSSWFIANFYWWIAPELVLLSPLALAYYFWIWLQGHHFFSVPSSRTHIRAMPMLGLIQVFAQPVIWPRRL